MSDDAPERSEWHPLVSFLVVAVPLVSAAVAVHAWKHWRPGTAAEASRGEPAHLLQITRANPYAAGTSPASRSRASGPRFYSSPSSGSSGGSSGSSSLAGVSSSSGHNGLLPFGGRQSTVAVPGAQPRFRGQ